MTPDSQPSSVPVLSVSRRRPWYRIALHYVRRGHLYCGLFLLPWVALYGVTAFLFNHPTAFSDQPTASFDRAMLEGTPMAAMPTAVETAAKVVDALRAKAGATSSYVLVEPDSARYTRDFAFATVKVEGQEISALFDIYGQGGTIRSKPVTSERVEEKAPFAIGGRSGPPSKGTGGPSEGRPSRTGPATAETFSIAEPVQDRIKASLPTVLERLSFPSGEIAVTSVPDLVFTMRDGEKLWSVTYNALSNSVSGRPADAPVSSEPLSTRRFLTRLHLAHGYPGDVNARWVWAVIVDAMAFVMLFWALSGLFMWWQLKATRRLGFLVLLVSAAAAVYVGISMHDVISSAKR